MIKYHINSYNLVSQVSRVDPEIEALVNAIDYDGDGVTRGRIDFLLDNGMKPITSDEMVLSDFTDDISQKASDFNRAMNG